MEPLLKLLSSWQGRGVVEAELERRGFTLHKIYQEQIKNYCHIRGIADDLNYYWDEVAKEWVMSAGRSDINERIFRGETAYRSAYLDNLYAKIDRQRYNFKIPFLHPCLNELRLDDSYGDKSEASNINLIVDKYKKFEVQRLSIDASGWDGTRLGLNNLLGDIVINKGFVLVSTRIWDDYVVRGGYRYVYRDFVVECAAVTGKYKTLAGSLDFRFRFLEKSNDVYIFKEYDFNHIVPGFSYYRIFNTPEAAVLGVLAMTQFIDVFISSFE